jgi:deoxyadenosine/deoxycytidine kinase
MNIYIEANIASGKTTFIGFLKDYFKDDVNIIREPVDKWQEHEDKDGKNILVKYYENMERWAFTFQVNCLSTRISYIQKLFNKNRAKDIPIIADSNIQRRT